MKRLAPLTAMALSLGVGAGPAVAAAPGALVYRDVTATTGIDFVQANGATGEKNCVEQMGSGVCVLDYDGDGRLDLYLVTSAGKNRLYRNLGSWRFVETTDEAGVGDESYGMGAAAADVDNDGDPDLYVTNFGANRLYRNDGRGAFRDVTGAAGVGDPRWGCASLFVDYDRDGQLDLYVVNYVLTEVPDQKKCTGLGSTVAIYCPPSRYDRAPDVLYRNRGDGTFEDVTARTGLSAIAGRGLGGAAADFDDDGWPDLYVANDQDPNFLFRNRGDGTFEEIGFFAGTSHSEDGVMEAGMGVTAGDYDNDGRLDLFVTNFIHQSNTLYHNEGGGMFFDVTVVAGLATSSLPYVGWGTKFFDFDSDGWNDLFVANGHTENDTEQVDPATAWKQPDLLYHNRGDGTFEDVTDRAAPVLREPRAGRGTAFADLDDDGDVDLVIVNQNDPVRVLENVGDAGFRWVGLRLVGGPSNRDAVGARVQVHAGGRVGTQEVQAGASFLSGNDPRLHFGLGATTSVDSVVVRWPSGVREVRRRLAVDRYHRLTEGQ